MSSLFNYELDEKNIRYTLQNAGRNSFYEDAWRDFELNYCREINKPASASVFKLPEINLNINRNIILPSVFILALIGLSAILINFIDFKSDKAQQVERKLEPNASNFKKAEVPQQELPKQENKIVAQKMEPVVKKDTVKASPNVISQSANMVVQSSQPASNTQALSSNLGTTIKSTTTVVPPVVSQAITATTNSVVPTQHRIRRKKTETVPSEQIETIKAPALIKTESESSDPEPDLEIKVD